MDVELLPALALLFGGIAAGAINVLAAGGSLITMPLLIFLGIPGTSANGTIRLAILVQGLTATLRFHRAGVVEWGEVPKLVCPVWAGTLAGAAVATNMADTDFKAMIGWVTLVAGALVAIDFKRFLKKRTIQPSLFRRASFIVALVIVGFYGGLVQAGVGYLLLAALTLGGGYDLLRANTMKVVLTMAFTPIALLVFGMNGKIHFGYAIILALGQAMGAYLGASITLRRGSALIRPILAVVVIAAAIRLLIF